MRMIKRSGEHGRTEFVSYPQEELQKKLEDAFGIFLTELAEEEIDPASLQEKDYWSVPKDIASRLSPLLQTAAGFGMNQKTRDVFQGAVKIVVPPHLAADAVPNRLSKLGEEVYSLTYRNKKGFVANGGIKAIDDTPIEVAQAAYSVFSLASVVTGQYFMQRIDREMENIQQTTDSILQFLELDKRSDLQAQQMFLSETVRDLEDITLCSAQQQASIVNVQNLRQKALAAALFYCGRIESAIEELEHKKYKASEWEETQRQLLPYIANYQLSLCAYGTSVFLEVMLTGNTERAYLRRLLDRMRIQQENYDQCLISCSERLLKYAEKADPQKFAFGLAKGVAAVAPVIGVSLTEWLEEMHVDMRKKLKDKLSAQIVELLETCAKAGQLQDTMKQIQQLDEISNEQMELIVDKGRLYMKKPKETQEKSQPA